MNNKGKELAVKHLMKKTELEHTHIENYRLGAKYCR
jgi:hypothetical protein